MAERRDALTVDRIVGVAIELADAEGLDAVSMRSVAARLGVVPMALYRHVANKEQLLDAMLDHVLARIERGEPTGEWKADARALIAGARRVMLRHAWSWRVMETRAAPSPAAMDHQEAMIRLLRDAGLSVGLVHHVMHALGSRLWGFTAEVYASSGPPQDPQVLAAMMQVLAARWPSILESASYAAHADDSVVGPGCDDEFEFFFAIDLLLDGAERLHAVGWEAP